MPASPLASNLYLSSLKISLKLHLEKALHSVNRGRNLNSSKQWTQSSFCYQLVVKLF
jgi:hypothetical protein